MAKYVVEIPVIWRHTLYHPGIELELTAAEGESAELAGRVRKQESGVRRQASGGKDKGEKPESRILNPESLPPSALAPETRHPKPEPRRRR